MRNYLLVTALALFSLPLFAQSTQAVDVSKLTLEQQKAVQAVANQMAEKKSDAPAILQAIQNIDSSKVRGWEEAGTEAGKAVGNFAKEVAIPAQSFLDSFVGKATFVLVFMNYGGGKLAQFAFSIFALIVLTPIFCFFMWNVFKRFVLQVITTTEKKYNPSPFLRFIGFNEVTTKIEKVTFDGSENIPSGWQAAIGWAFVVLSSFIFFGLLWPKW